MLGIYDVYKGPANDGPSLSAASQIPHLDVSYMVPAMAAVTTSLSFGITASTTYDSPYALARKYATLDHLTNGRVGWNVGP